MSLTGFLRHALSQNMFAARTLYAALRRLGVYAAPGSHPVPALLMCLGIDKVLDVGANSGQFARRLRVYGFQGTIVSFEPVSDAFAELQRHVDRDRRWSAVRCALGDRNGEAFINVSESTVLSSMLAQTEFLSQNYGGSKCLRSEKVEMRRLDSLYREYVRPGDNVLLKIDTQGFEREVLKGAGRFLDEVTAIYMEVSFRPLYQGEPLIEEMSRHLQDLGFTLVHLEPLYHNLEHGQISQADGFYVRL